MKNFIKKLPTISVGFAVALGVMMFSRLLSTTGFNPLFGMIMILGLTFSKNKDLSSSSIIWLLIANFVVDFCWALKGYFDLEIQLSVYGSYLLMWLASVVLSKSKSYWVKGFLSVLSGNAIFFLVTNYVSWILMSDITNPSWCIYSHDLSGLISCYIASIPYSWKGALVSVFVVTGYCIYSFLTEVKGYRLFKTSHSVSDLNI